MELALNLIALVMVIGLSWVAMMWMSGRFHGERNDFTAEPFGGDRPVDDAPRDLVTNLPGGPPNAGDCATCHGSGARKNQGRLAPCPVCEGTGVLS